VRIVEKDGAAILSDRRLLWCDEITVCEERDATGATVLKRFFPQGETEAGIPYYYVRDHLGSVRILTDAAVSVRALYEYDPYGRSSRISGDRDATFGFSGHWEHRSTALTLAPFRAYDSALGRWVSEDPLGLRAGDVNLYRYAANRPVTLIDPSGRFAITLSLAAAAAAKAGLALTTIAVANEIAKKIVEFVAEPDVAEPATDYVEPPRPANDNDPQPRPPRPEPIKVPPVPGRGSCPDDESDPEDDPCWPAFDRCTDQCEEYEDLTTWQLCWEQCVAEYELCRGLIP
jgi:RHS repeat-associated protein